MHYGLRILGATAALALAAAPVHAAVTISSAATQNMSCSSGICTPTAKSAVLNAGDLETQLASGNATVTTTGSGVEADDIHLSSALAWASSSTLSLEAHRSIAINAAVSITGESGLTLDSDKKGTISFGKKGNVTFANRSSQLTINGGAYTLVGDIKTLAGDIASNPSGDFALANGYDASADGTYNGSPIGTVFAGTFEGLGNVISNLSIDGGTQVEDGTYEGLFVEIAASGTARDLGLSKVMMSASQTNFAAGALVGENLGAIISSYANGAIVAHERRNKGPEAGGLAGDNSGVIANSHSGVSVTAKIGGVGGLVGSNEGTISGSFATGPVSGQIAGGLAAYSFSGAVTDSYATGNVDATPIKTFFTVGGGLVGELFGGTLSNSYATGGVTSSDNSWIGGLVGRNESIISSSYSTGVVTGGIGSSVGGLIGFDQSQPGSITDAFWDTDTSGITDPSKGAGNIANDPGISGLTTAQFQSGLPEGFDPSVWAEKSNLNGGLPYLLANPPPK
jgi:hypothetical protein